MAKQYTAVVHLHIVDNKTKAHLALLGTNILYGAGYSIAKYIMPRLIEPLGFIFIRAGAAALLFWFSYLLGSNYRVTISKKDWGVLVLGGLFGVAVNQMLFFLGLNLTMPIHASLVMMSTPLLITVAALIILRERIGRNKLIGLLLGIAGAALLMSAGRELTTAGTNTALGDILVFFNAASYAIYLVIIKPLMQRYRPLVVIRWVFLFGFMFVMPFGWQQFADIQWQQFTLPDYAALAFTVIGTTFLAYLWNIYALGHLSASTAGAYIYLQPFFAGIISVIFMGEAVTLAKIFAALLIFAGVYLVNFGQRKKELKQ
ncbi:MAG: DMT family transporter [Taibaiella sp.]|nr:DMT family transporter [Taibaiella sp.]